MSDQPAQDTGRPGETEEEKLDRNTIELLNELRVVATGIQVMFGFLVIVPFNTGFAACLRSSARTTSSPCCVSRSRPCS
jgi:Family of unknown function (DUF6328)